MKKMKLVLILAVLGGAMAASSVAAWATSEPDFYQSVSDETDIKTYFLRRVANASNPDDPPMPVYGYTQAGLHTQGTCFLDNDSSQLNDTFKTIAKKIKLRIIG